MKRYLLFDFDGTLFHTAPGILHAVNKMLAQLGRPPTDYETVVSLIGDGLRTFVERLNLNDHKTEEGMEELLQIFRSHYGSVAHQHSILFEGVEGFLKQWTGDIAIVSNKSERFVRELVEHSELSQFSWKTLIGGDTFYPHKKPHAKPFLAALEAGGATLEETLIVGDGLPDIDGAKALGMTSVAVDFGYTSIDRLMARGADYRISHFNELKGLISSIRQDNSFKVAAKLFDS